MASLSKLTFLLLLSTLMISCVPEVEKIKKDEDESSLEQNSGEFSAENDKMKNKNKSWVYTSDFEPENILEDTIKTITLPYFSSEGRNATSCQVQNLKKVTIYNQEDCLCTNGSCRIRIISKPNYSGKGSFTYRITANGKKSNKGKASFEIQPRDDAPVAADISPSSFVAGTRKLITFSYTDIENDPASSCQLTNTFNVSITSSCACSSGVCRVEVTGSEGSAYFYYRVFSNNTHSNWAYVNYSITASEQPDSTTVNNFNPGNATEDVAKIITLPYRNSANKAASSCSVSNLNNLVMVSGCTCQNGNCSVTVKGTSNYHGSASFYYRVNVDGQNSNQAIASFSINPVDDSPVALNISPSSFDEGSSSMITLNYVDAENDRATSCQLSSMTNVSITSACSCSSGVCRVGVSGQAGNAQFYYRVVANSRASNYAQANYSISSTQVDNPDVAESSKVGILFVYTRSGRDELLQYSRSRAGNSSLSLNQINQNLINVANERFEKNSVASKLFEVAGDHFFNIDLMQYIDQSDVDEGYGARAIQVKLVSSPDYPFANIRALRRQYNANVLVLVTGDADEGANDKSGGNSSPGRGYMTIDGTYLGVDAILEHELGHEFGIWDHNHEEGTIMSLPALRNTEYFSPEEVAIMKPNLPGYLNVTSDDGGQVIDCNQESQSKSRYNNSSEATNLAFRNNSNFDIKVYWLNYDGNRQLSATVKPGDSYGANAQTTHNFLIEAGGKCLGIVTNPTNTWKNFHVRN